MTGNLDLIEHPGPNHGRSPRAEPPASRSLPESQADLDVIAVQLPRNSNGLFDRHASNKTARDSFPNADYSEKVRKLMLAERVMKTTAAYGLQAKIFMPSASLVLCCLRCCRCLCFSCLSSSKRKLFLSTTANARVPPSALRWVAHSSSGKRLTWHYRLVAKRREEEDIRSHGCLHPHSFAQRHSERRPEAVVEEPRRS